MIKLLRKLLRRAHRPSSQIIHQTERSLLRSQRRAGLFSARQQRKAAKTNRRILKSLGSVDLQPAHFLNGGLE